MFDWLKKSRVVRILWVLFGMILAFFGSIKDFVNYIETELGLQFQTFNAFQVILVSAGIMIVFLAIYDWWKTRKRGLNPRTMVVCRKCGSFFDFQNPRALIVLTPKADLATGTCPNCGDRASYPRKEWLENLYDKQQGK
jgi:hypothetical protein